MVIPSRYNAKIRILQRLLSFIKYQNMINLIINRNFSLCIKVGARMVVQHPEAWPMIDEYGIDLHPGMYTAAAINEVIHNHYFGFYISFC